MGTTATRTDAERARSFDRAIFARGADEVVEHPWGVQLRTPTLPLVRNLNGLYASAPLDPELIAALAPIAVLVNGDAPPLGPGWEQEVGVFMAHRGEPPAPDPRATVVDLDAIAGLRREWLEAEIPTAEIVEQLLVSDRRLFSQTPTRAYTIDGAATTLLMGDGPVRMVEDVYTTPERRREGLASALVHTAVAAAYAEGAELVFLPTSAGSDAHRLYTRLGFFDISRTTGLWRVSG